MTHSSPFQTAPFAALAEVYAQAGLADYGLRSVPTYLDYAYSMNWAGRRVLDVDCGLALTTWWLTEQGYRAAGLEHNPYLFAQAQRTIRESMAAAEAENIMHTPPELAQISPVAIESPIGHVDLVLAVNGVVNTIHSLNDLAAMFKGAWRVLEPGKLLMFDAHTLHGMAVDADGVDRIVVDNGDDLMVIVRSTFSFETLVTIQQVTVYRRTGECWTRQDEVHALRGYPVQGIASVLERAGFVVERILNPDMTPFDAAKDPFGRAVFVALKPGDGPTD